MRKTIRTGCMLLAILLAVWNSMNVSAFAAQTEEPNYERDYLVRIFNSDNGLEGSAVTCLLSSDDGFIWAGSYTGLYRYDGTEFQKKTISKSSNITVNDIVQDKDGNLWIGTNGDGIYRYDGAAFTKRRMDNQPDGTESVNKLYMGQDDLLLAATKNGLLSIDLSNGEQAVHYYDETAGMELSDIAETEHGETALLAKDGTILLLNHGKISKMTLTGRTEGSRPRCLSSGKDNYFYIGTKENKVLKVSDTGAVLREIDSGELSSINAIYEFEDGRYWVCCDNGIGLLENDTITRKRFLMDDSMEEVCVDYQGNFWFASSRQGIMQVYENGFSDLGTYWGLHQTVNSIQQCGEKVYVGTDRGLYCYQGRNEVEDALTAACGRERIRQLTKDSEGNLWVATYRSGIIVLHPNGEITACTQENSGLTTDQTRCAVENADGGMLIGTEEGLFLAKNGTITRPVQDEELNSRRILDIAVRDDTIYAATDGYGVYELKNGAVQAVYARQQGLHSGVVMKAVPSDTMQGVWLVTGEAIYFLGGDGQLRRAADIGVANSLDFVLDGKGHATILAGNGLFKIDEAELLENEPKYYAHLTHQDGLPIDFTANAGNTIENGVLYLCGTMGAACVELDNRPPKREVKLYLNSVTADGEPVDITDDVIELPANANRITLDIRPIDYVRQNLYVSYQLDGADSAECWLEDDNVHEISYTNLAGGDYTYRFRVYDGNSDECIAEMKLSLHKNYRYWEEPRVRNLLIMTFIGIWVLLFMLIIARKEKSLRHRYRAKAIAETNAELEKMAYTDLVTGAYNRNRFEQEKETLDMNRIYAFFTVSVDHQDYIRNKYGSFYFEGVLRKAVETIRSCSAEKIELYRVSENVFYYWLEQPVKLESYITQLKKQFAEKSEDDAPLSLSVGAVYNNTVDKERLRDLIDRCEKMRLLDEKHAEASFIEAKMKLL